MTWGRFDDGFTDRPVWEGMPYEVRWHYVAMIMWCCRTGRYDGTIRGADARRCSDLDDPAAALAALVTAGLLAEADGGYRLVLIDEHALPAHLRDENRKPAQRDRKRRSRARTDRPVTGDVTRDTGSGRDGPGRGEPPAHTRAHERAPASPDAEHEPETDQRAEQPTPVDVPAAPRPVPASEPDPEPPAVPRCACGEPLLLSGRTQCERCRLAEQRQATAAAPVVSSLPEPDPEPEGCEHTDRVRDEHGFCARCVAVTGRWRSA